MLQRNRAVIPSKHWHKARAFQVVAVVAFGLAGCMPLPFASPPLRASFNVGPSGGFQQLDGKVDDGVVASLGGRFGLHPLGAVRSLRERPADVGIGYLIETTVTPNIDGPTAHGPYIEVAAHPWQARQPKPGRLSRLAVFATGDVLFATRHGGFLSGGGTLGVGFEWGKWVADPFVEVDEDSLDAVLGYAEGEASIGVQLATGFRMQQGLPWWLVTVGLTVRLPASAGVAVIQLIR